MESGIVTTYKNKGINTPEFTGVWNFVYDPSDRPAPGATLHGLFSTI